MWNGKDHQQHRNTFPQWGGLLQLEFMEMQREVSCSDCENQQSSSTCCLHGRAFTKPSVLIEVPKELVSYPGRARLSSLAHSWGRDQCLPVVSAWGMPPGVAFRWAVCWVKSRGTEMSAESSFLSFASLSTGKPWMTFDTVSLFTSLSNCGHIKAL